MQTELKWCAEKNYRTECTLHPPMSRLKYTYVAIEEEYKIGKLVVALCIVGGCAWAAFVWWNGAKLHLDNEISKTIGSLLGGAAALIPARLYKDSFWTRNAKKAQIEAWLCDAVENCGLKHYRADLVERGLALADKLEGVEKK